MRILLIGSRGQLGTDLVPVLGSRYQLRCIDHDRLEISDVESVGAAMSEHRPELVINTAAFNRVDDCEERFDEALRVNAIGPHLLARACQASGSALLHVSTDFVFDGDMASPRTEEDWPRPRSAYGISKRAGELAVLASCPQSYVVRTCGLFGHAGSSGKGGNFVETMLRLQAAGRTIRVVNDQVVAPTSTADLAQKIAELIDRRVRYGIYHLTASGECSWFEFARAIFELSGLEVDLSPWSTAESGALARRPSYSVLANDALRAAGVPRIRHWREGLAEYLAGRARDRLTPIAG